MTPRRFYLLSFLFACMALPLVSLSQKDIARPVSQESTGESSQLFASEQILSLKLSGNINALFKDRSDNSSYHPLLLQYYMPDSTLVSLAIRAKTRGHFRKDKRNCKMPPILLDFPKEAVTKNTLFDHQVKLKLVVPCQGDDYVIKEWLIYKLYNLISQNSFKARLALVEFDDSLNREKKETHYCFLLEDEKQMAKRNDCFVVKTKMLDMRNTKIVDFRKMAVFQYMIGNTDWGIPYLQNIVLITPDSLMAPIPVPYDFDHAGIVAASYAAPAPELQLSSTRDRLYRGYCEKNIEDFKPTFQLFDSLKNEIYAVYTECPLLTGKYIKFATNYLDDFYKTINSSRLAEFEFSKPCRTDVRVEIRGLKK